MTKRLGKQEIKERKDFRELTHNLNSALILEFFEKRYPSFDLNKLSKTLNKKQFEEWLDKNHKRWRETIKAYKNGWNDALKMRQKLMRGN